MQSGQNVSGGGCGGPSGLTAYGRPTVLYCCSQPRTPMGRRHVRVGVGEPRRPGCDPRPRRVAKISTDGAPTATWPFARRAGGGPLTRPSELPRKAVPGRRDHAATNRCVIKNLLQRAARARPRRPSPPRHLPCHRPASCARRLTATTAPALRVPLPLFEAGRPDPGRVEQREGYKRDLYKHWDRGLNAFGRTPPAQLPGDMTDLLGLRVVVEHPRRTIKALASSPLISFRRGSVTHFAQRRGSR